MAKPWRCYTGELYENLRYLAPWPPSGQVAVGEVGAFRDRSFERHTTLERLGVEPTSRDGADVRERGWTSTATRIVRPELEVAAPVDPGLVAGAELQVKFEAKHAILMRAERSHERSLDRLDLIEDSLLRLHDEGKWRKDWVLVTHVVHAERLVALIANGRGTEATLRLSAGAIDDVSALATARGVLSVMTTNGMAYEEHDGRNATPLYRAVRVQRRRLRGDRVKRISKRGRARPGLAEFEVAEVTF